jgi:putative ABC transport system permease protein
MLFWTIIKVALKSLVANKLRTLLAMLGIIIGVGAVISMLGMGAGAQKQVLERISQMGTNLLIIRPAQRGSMGVMSGTQQNLTVEDAEALLREIPSIRQVAPVVSGNAQVKYFNKNARVSTVGTSVTYFPVRNFEVEKGRSFTEGEVENMSRVAVIGPTTAETLFETDNPLGKIIKINNITFRVEGVLKSKGDQGWFNPDDQVLIPYTTAMKQLFGQDYLREIDVQAKTGADLTQVQEEVTAVLRRRHRILPGAPDDFSIRNQADIIDTASEVSKTFTVLLGSIASISLLVGGIGIMNIMLVTVTERTREIGVRKAIGARNRDILRQFLLESILMSGLGGVMGIGLGFGGAGLIGWFTQMPTLVEPLSIVMALTVAASVGIFFGLYPAMRAARLDPIESLRYE